LILSWIRFIRSKAFLSIFHFDICDWIKVTFCDLCFNVCHANNFDKTVVKYLLNWFNFMLFLFCSHNNVEKANIKSFAFSLIRNAADRQKRTQRCSLWRCDARLWRLSRLTRIIIRVVDIRFQWVYDKLNKMSFSFKVNILFIIISSIWQLKAQMFTSVHFCDQLIANKSITTIG
jgi:hypothetical protein